MDGVISIRDDRTRGNAARVGEAITFGTVGIVYGDRGDLDHEFPFCRSSVRKFRRGELIASAGVLIDMVSSIEVRPCDVTRRTPSSSGAIALASGDAENAEMSTNMASNSFFSSAKLNCVRRELRRMAGVTASTLPRGRNFSVGVRANAAVWISSPFSRTSTRPVELCGAIDLLSDDFCAAASISSV